MESFLQNRPSLATASRYVRPAIEPGFQPFLRPASPGQQEVSSLPSHQANTALTVEEAEPQIQLMDRDGSVERIIITCVCCKRIELQCEY
jgi:hypothetical protein